MDYLLHILVITGIYIILTASLNLIVGYTGLASLGHAAFATVGAYTSSLLALHYGLSPWIGMISGGFLAAVLGAVVAWPSFRLKGDYLAIATFGAAVIVYSITLNWVNLTRGPMGLPGIPGFFFFTYPLVHVWQYLLLVVFVATISSIAISAIVHSPFGRILRAIREDEIAALALGKKVSKYKTIVFVLGAFFAGIAGSLYAHYISYIDPSSFSPMESITILLMVVFGGMGTMAGSFIGATALVILPELLRYLGLPASVAAPLRQMIYGLLLVILMLRRPQGILGKFKWAQR